MGQNEKWFRQPFLWQARYGVNLNGVLKGSKVPFCEAIVVLDLGHAGDSVWQVPHLGCLRLICRGCGITCRPP